MPENNSPSNDSISMFNALAKKRTNDNANSIAQTKAKRQTSAINRLGTGEFEENDDDLFEKVHHDRSDDLVEIGARNEDIAPSIEPLIGSFNETGNDNTQSIMSPGEKILLKKMQDLMAELKLVQKGVIELSGQVASHEVHENGNEKSLKRLKRNELIELGLPLKNVEQLTTFESKLKDDEFYRKTFDSFKRIGGTSGVSNGEMVLQEMFGYLMEREFLKKTTWTGKADPKTKVKKIKFELYTGVIALIYEVCTAADRRYTNVQCRSDMVYKVFKYAYRIKLDAAPENAIQMEVNPVEHEPAVEFRANNTASQPNGAENHLRNGNQITQHHSLAMSDQYNAYGPTYHNLQPPAQPPQQYPSPFPHPTQNHQLQPYESQSNQQFPYRPPAPNHSYNTNATGWYPPQ